MITDGKKWHYLTVINLSALFKEKLSNRTGDLYYLNSFNSYTTENKLKEHEEIIIIAIAIIQKCPSRLKKY